MGTRRNRSLARAALLCFAATALAQQPTIGPEYSGPFREGIEAGRQLQGARKLKEAEGHFRRLLSETVDARDQSAQATVRYALGTVLFAEAQYPAARDELTLALEEFEGHHYQAGVAYASFSLGLVAQYTGDYNLAGQRYNEALRIYRQLDMLQQQAKTLSMLAQLDPENQELVEEQLAIARRLGDPSLKAHVLHDTGDILFSKGLYDEADRRYQQAFRLYEQSGDKKALATVLTSQGRLQRAHGHPEKSLVLYRQALALQRSVGDRLGEIQTTNAMSVAYSYLHQGKRALELLEHALALAKATGSDRFIDWASANLATGYGDVGRYREEAEILERIVARRGDSANLDHRYGALATAYFNLGSFHRASEASERAIQLARQAKDIEYLTSLLSRRAEIAWKLGELDHALEAAQESLLLTEQVRSHLVPTDFMKRGFAEGTLHSFDLMIQMLAEAHQAGRALQFAQQARARAFLDLLATRELEGDRVARMAALRDLVAKGFDTSAPPPEWTHAGAELQSLVAVSPMPLAQIQATARRLDSTILSYWVSDNATYIWVVPPAGDIQMAQSGVARKQLEQKIRALSPNRPAASGPRGAAAWSELYRLLIGPVEKWLPRTEGSLLTIEPQGVLLTLPFGGLRDEKGRYLVERFTLHSVPAVSLLQFTEHKKLPLAVRDGRYLLVADPAGSAYAEDKTLLPALPGARREIAAIARMLPAASVQSLQGKEAGEQRFAELARHSSVIHLATHAVMLDSDPLSSYLMLSRTGSAPNQDGRLTVQDVYGLDLHADLVFVSACRSGTGQLSSDGINGLTRAFLFAGTPSVIATTWDVADETAQLLVTGFYRSWLKGDDKARALRSAQLALLHALRAGGVSVATPFGKVVLPEDPVYWASFVLQGEP